MGAVVRLAFVLLLIHSQNIHYLSFHPCYFRHVGIFSSLIVSFPFHCHLERCNTTIHTQQTTDMNLILSNYPTTMTEYCIEQMICRSRTTTGRPPVSWLSPTLEQLVHWSGYFQRRGHQDTRSLRRRTRLQTRKGHSVAPRGRGKALPILAIQLKNR